MSEIGFNLRKENYKETWITPKFITDELGKFDLDPCSAPEMPYKIADKEYRLPEDGLNLPWNGRVWLNPPYGKKTFDWINKLSNHKDGIALIFARTETKGFYKEIWQKAHSLFFLKGRVNFLNHKFEVKSSGNAPSCLVSYSVNDSDIIKNSNLIGKQVYL